MDRQGLRARDWIALVLVLVVTPIVFGMIGTCIEKGANW